MFPPEAVELLTKKTPATFTTLLPDGSPHSVIAGVWLEGDQLVTNTAPTARRLKNLRADPRVNVLVPDPNSAMRYVEVRGTATIHVMEANQVTALLKGHAEQAGGPSSDERQGRDITVLQVRVTPTKVNFSEFDPRQLGPANRQGRPGQQDQGQRPPAVVVLPDGTIREDAEGRWIEFERPVAHAPEAVWAALSECRRLVVWQHPVEFFPDLREGATVYAHLNPAAKAFALGKVTVCEPPHALAFRWTTTHPKLSPDVTLTYTVQAGTLTVSYGPFGKDDAVLPMAASLHIHLDHLDQAITTPEDQLPTAPWPSASVVTQSGQMFPVTQAYAGKYAELAVGMGPGPGGPTAR